MKYLSTTSSLIYSIFLFHLVFMFQLASGIALFHFKIGWTLEEIGNFYAGDGNFSAGRGLIGSVESALPHLISIGIVCFIVSHFLAFCESRFRNWSGVGLWFFAVLQIFSGPAISAFGREIAFLKLLSFTGFQLFFFFCCGIILKEAFPKGQRRFVALFKNT